MKKFRIVILVSALLILCTSIALAAEKPPSSILPTNHVISQAFTRDGDYYRPSGRILSSVSKNEFSKVTTLDELMISPKNTAKILTITLMNPKGVVATQSYTIPDSKYEFMHVTCEWSLADKPPGMYLFILFADKTPITMYSFKITN